MSDSSKPSAAPADDDLDALVRRVDPDRWLASRFIADAERREDVIALYALNYELAHVAETVREPLMGEIRLTWWREAIEEIFDGRPVRKHPVLLALAQAVRRRGLAREPLETMVEARFADLDHEAFADEAAAEAYVDGTAGALMALAAGVLGAADVQALRPAAQAWGQAGLARIGRAPSSTDMATKVASSISAARRAARGLPVAAFPAVAYATLAPAYARGRPLSDLEKRVRLLAAAILGRL